MVASQSQARSSVTSIDDVGLVVDADSHLTESVDDLYPYMDDRDEGIKQLIKLSEIPFSDIFSITAPTPIFPDGQDEGTADVDLWSGANDIEGKHDLMDEYGIDHSIVNPTLVAVVNTVNNSRIARALVSAYNRYLIDNFADSDRISNIMVVAPHEPNRAAEEIDEWADEDSVVGVLIPPAGLVPAAGDRRYDPIYEAAQRHDLPVHYHSNTGAVHRSFPMQHNWSQTYAEEHAIMHPFTHMWNLSSLLFNGTPERFPDVEFVFNEAGIGWIPYMTWRLDDHYLELPHDVPVLEKLPSEYISDQFYFTTQPLGHTARDGRHIAQIIEMIGPDSVMYSADLPHPDFDLPAELFDRIRSQFDDEAVEKIMGKNAADLFGIEA